jgi:hypothetical protein
MTKDQALIFKYLARRIEEYSTIRAFHPEFLVAPNGRSDLSYTKNLAGFFNVFDEEEFISSFLTFSFNLPRRSGKSTIMAELIKLAKSLASDEYIEIVNGGATEIFWKNSKNRIIFLDDLVAPKGFKPSRGYGGAFPPLIIELKTH